MSTNADIEEARKTMIGRFCTLGGSVLFFIGSLIIAILGYQSYMSTINPTT